MIVQICLVIWLEFMTLFLAFGIIPNEPLPEDAFGNINAKS